jgi:hypothetical protein
MTLPTIAKLPYANPTTPSLTLAHKLVPSLSGRHILMPELDIDLYQFRAAIDWIEVKIHFGRGVQLREVQLILRRFFARNCHVVAEDQGPGGEFTRCTVRLQKPSNLATIPRAHEALISAFGEAGRACINAVEIGIDAYPDRPCSVARGLLLGAIQRSIWTDQEMSRPDSRPRSVSNEPKHNIMLSPDPENDPSGDRRAAPTRHKTPFLDGKMMLGAMEDDVMIKVLDKVTHQPHPNAAHQILTECEKRVRIELTLRGDELTVIGLSDISSLRCFPFSEIQKRYLRFDLPTFDMRVPIRKGVDIAHNHSEKLNAQTYLIAGMTGLKAREQVMDERRPKVQQHAMTLLNAVGRSAPKADPSSEPAFVSYENLSRKITTAFQHLDQREVTAWACAPNR